MNLTKHVIVQFVDRLRQWHIFLKEKKLYVFFKIVISLIAIGIIARNFSHTDFANLFSNIRLYYALLALLVTFFVSLLFVLRNYVILAANASLSFIDLYLINRVGNFFNFFLVGGIGQEFSRFLYLKHYSKKMLILTSLLDRILGFLSLLLIILVFLFESDVQLPFQKNYIFALVLAMSLAALVAIYLLSIKCNVPFLKIVFSLLVSIVYSVGLILISYLTFLAVNAPVSLNQLFLIIPSLSILLMLPISVNGVGLRELFLNSTLGVGFEVIVTYSVIEYLIYLLLSSPGLFYYLRKKN